MPRSGGSIIRDQSRPPPTFCIPADDETAQRNTGPLTTRFSYSFSHDDPVIDLQLHCKPPRRHPYAPCSLCHRVPTTLPLYARDRARARARPNSSPESRDLKSRIALIGTAMAQALPTFTADSEFAELETPRGPKAGSLSITALARFEFEAGKGNDGTKILMIEWEDDDISRSSTEGSWHVSWTGKATVMPAVERPSDNTRRFYFLLPPNVTIPPVVTLSYEPTTTSTDSTPSSKAHETLQLNPLPAIFPPELGATGRAAGKRGVLHTIWAKKRLRVLENEIRDESLSNVEGIALHMAVQEKEWIEANFGVSLHAVESVVSSHDSSQSSSVYPTGPATPVSPISGRKLTDKLKGLKLQTSERDLSVKDGEYLSTWNPDGIMTD